MAKMKRSFPPGRVDRAHSKPLTTKYPIGGGRYVSVSSENFFGKKIYWLSCFCNDYETPRSSNKDVAVEQVTVHISQVHPEALAEFSEFKDQQDLERAQEVLLFLDREGSILSTTDTTPREETLGRYTRRSDKTRSIPNPGNIAKRIQGRKPPQTTISEQVKGEGATEVQVTRYSKDRTYFGHHILKILVDRKGQRVFVSEILESEEVKRLNLEKKQVQNAIRGLVYKGEPIRTITAGNVWVYEDEVVTPRPAQSRDPIVSKVVEKKYGDDESPTTTTSPTQVDHPTAPSLQTETVVVLSRRRNTLVFVDSKGEIWKAEPAVF